MQWLSLIILTLGCLIKQFEHSSKSVDASNLESSTDYSWLRYVNLSKIINIHLIWILVQIFCSCFAGVYNEYLLKSDRTAKVDIMIQNVFMYLDSILCNMIFLIFFDHQQTDLSAAEKIQQTFQLIFSGSQIIILLIIFNNAAVGIVTSFFLKSMNAILKTFASALELIFTSILAWIFFGIPVSIYTFLAIFIVSYAVYLYSLNPVVNLAKSTDTNSSQTSDTNSKANSEQTRRLNV